MNHCLLLFDVDATLLKTGGAGMRAMMHVNETLFEGRMVWDGIQAGGNLDPLIFNAAASAGGLSTDHDIHRRFHDAYLNRLVFELDTNRHAIELLPGVMELLETLRKREAESCDVVLGLLTGNYTGAVPIKLGSVGIDPDWFSITAFGDQGPDRPALVELALRRYEAAFGRAAVRNRVIVIGDTPRDVQCAKAHGCVSFGVATGSFTQEQLLEAGADYTVENLADAKALLQLLEPTASD